MISTTILVATELCIQWNGFHVNSLTRTGQLIPVLIAAVAIIRVLFLAAMEYVSAEDLRRLQNYIPGLL